MVNVISVMDKAIETGVEYRVMIETIILSKEGWGVHSYYLDEEGCTQAINDLNNL